MMTRRKFLRHASIASVCVGIPALARSAEIANRLPLLCGQIGVAHAHASGKMQAMRNLPQEWKVIGVVEPDPERRKGAE